MKKLTNNELKNIKGGSLSVSALGIGIGISVVVAFLVGVVSGFTNPEPCGGEEWENWQQRSLRK